VLQERSVQRLGRRYAKKIDLHLICATNDDLDNLVPRGRFREDLYYRIDVMPILVPPPARAWGRFAAVGPWQNLAKSRFVLTPRQRG
jgi:transcriptional regulator of acetoin/glycerol metabolism